MAGPAPTSPACATRIPGRATSAARTVTLVETVTKKPWWQMARTPGWGFGLGAFWLGWGALRWWWRDPDDTWVVPTSAVLFALLGLAFLASSVAVVRRQRAAKTSAAPRS